MCWCGCLRLWSHCGACLYCGHATSQHGGGRVVSTRASVLTPPTGGLRCLASPCHAIPVQARRWRQARIALPVSLGIPARLLPADPAAADTLSGLHPAMNAS